MQPYIRTVMLGLPTHPLTIPLVDAARQGRRDDARYYSTEIILSVPNMSRDLMDAVYHLGHR